MDTRLLRAFIILADTENYREASSRLYISQPALTKQIKLLENQLDLKLFERGRHGAMLTEHGRILLPYAKQALNHMAELLNQAIVLRETPPLSLNVGFGISTFQEASFFVARLQEQLPNLTIQLDDMPSDTMREKLHQHQLDIAFIRFDHQDSVDSLVSHPLKTEVLALAIAKDHPQNSAINDYLTRYPLLMLRAERGFGLYQQIQQYLQSENIHIAPLQEANDIQTLVALVTAKIGISLVPFSARHIGGENIDFIPIQHNPNAKWQIAVVWQTSLPKAWQTTFERLLEEIHVKFANDS
ncbi:LysR family transcriptional regulator [Providencia sp. Me31A]|uniref:LysR family transcriptional regulator n=1 Tax=Providencia sp. Me31A TaxID=3392637 RepID=UPI003D2DCCC2